MATRVASRSTVDAAPLRPTATGALVTGGAACAGDPLISVPTRAAAISADNAVVRRTIITPPRASVAGNGRSQYAVPRPRGRQRATSVSKVWWHLIFAENQACQNQRPRRKAQPPDGQEYAARYDKGKPGSRSPEGNNSPAAAMARPTGYHSPSTSGATGGSHPRIASATGMSVRN